MGPWLTSDAYRRFLRARNYVPCAAFKQYAATVAWRQQLGLDAMYTNADISHFEAMRRLVCDLNFLTLLLIANFRL